MSRYTTVECAADVDIFDLSCSLSDNEKLELAHLLLSEVEDSSSKPLNEQLRLLGHAIERCDENSVADLLHRICFDQANVPVINRLRIEPLQVAA